MTVWGHGFAAEVIDETYPRVGMALDGIVCLHQPHLREARRALAGGRHTLKRPLVVAVPVELADKLPAIGVPERYRHILGRQLQHIDHVPAREMTGSEVEAALPPRRAPDGLPVVGASACGPVRATDRREAELPFVGQSKNRITRGLGQRSLTR